MNKLNKLREKVKILLSSKAQKEHVKLIAKMDAIKKKGQDQALVRAKLVDRQENLQRKITTGVNIQKQKRKTRKKRKKRRKRTKRHH